MQNNKFVVGSGGGGLGNLFTAVANHVATSPSARGNMIRYSRKQFPSPLLPDPTTNMVLSKLKAFADSNIDETGKLKFVSGRVENIVAVWKMEKMLVEDSKQII